MHIQKPTQELNNQLHRLLVRRQLGDKAVLLLAVGLSLAAPLALAALEALAAEPPAQGRGATALAQAA
jgi:hypothetical protein